MFIRFLIIVNMKKHILFSLLLVFLTVGFIFCSNTSEAATGTSTIMSAPQSNNRIGVSRDVPAIRLELNSTTSPAEILNSITITIATSTNASSTEVSTSSFEWVGIVKDVNGNGFSDLPSPDILLATSTVTGIATTTTINISNATSAIGTFFVVFKTSSSTYWTDNGAPESSGKVAQAIVINIATDGVVASSTAATINATTTQPFIADIHSQAPDQTKVSAQYQSGAYKIFDTNGAGGVGELGILNIYSTSTAGAAAIATTTMSSNGNFSQTSIGSTYLSSVWLDLNDAAQNATSSKVQYNLPALPSVSSIAAFTNRIIINTNKNLRGDQATLCSNYTLNGSALVCGSPSQPFIEFSGNQMVIKNLSLTQGSTASLSVSGITDANPEAFPFTYSTTTLLVQLASVPTVSLISPNSGKAGDTVTITGTNFGTATGSVWFSGGFDPQTGPLQPIQATSTSWSSTSTIVTAPTGSQSGPITIVSSAGMMSDVTENSFFDVVGNVYIKLALVASSSPVTTSTNMRIFIGGKTGENVYYVGDNSTTTFDATDYYYTIPNISSGGFTWAYDASGNYVSSAGNPLSQNTSSSPQILIFSTSTTKKVSGTITLGTSCTGDGQNKWVAVFAIPQGATSTAPGPGGIQPSFFQTNVSCTTSYNLALAGNGLYQVEAHLPPSTTSTPLLDPAGQQVNISDATPTATVNLTFTSASRKIYGQVVNASSGSLGDKNNDLWIFANQPTSGGKSSVSRPNSSGYFSLYASTGSYKIGVGGPGMPMTVERDIIVTASSTFDTTSTQVAITIKLEPPTSYISGYVKDGSGNAVSGVDIFAWCEGSPAGGRSVSDSQGFYKMFVPACSNYHVSGFSQNYGQLAEQTSIVVSPSSNPTVNFTLSSDNFVNITGSVTQNSSALSGADIWLTQGSFGPSVGWAKTSTDGSFSVKIRKGLSGLYLHAAIMGQGEIANQLLNSGNVINASSSVGVISASVATIEIRLMPGNTFAVGTVFIGAHSSMGGGFTNTREATSTDYDTYRIRVPYSGSTLYTIDGGIQNFGPIPQATTTVSADKTITIDLSSVSFYNVSGTVTSTVSGAVSDAFVWAGGSAGGGGAKTDANGNFSFKLRAGVYDIGVGQPGYSGSMLTAQNISTTTTGLSLTLTQSSQTITGTVKYSGSALANVRVWADNGSGGWAGATSEADGSFSLNVSAGSWTLNAIADGYQLSAAQVVTAPGSGVVLNMTAVSFDAKRKTQSVTPTQGGVIQTDDAKVEIPQGALGTSGTNVQMDVTDTMSTPTKKGGRVVGTAKSIQATYASGDNQGQQITTLSQNVTIEIVLTKAQLEDKSITTIAGAQKLKIGYDDPTATSWAEIPTTVILNPATSTLWSDLVSITLKGTTAHFSTFAPIDPIGSNPPPTPTGFSATAGVEKVTLNWSASAGATKYDVYRKSGNEYPYLAQTINTTTYIDSGLLATVTYYYKVSALDDSNNESAATDAVYATALVYVGSGGGGSYIPATPIVATTTSATTTEVVATTTTAITTTTVPIVSAPSVSPAPTAPAIVQQITKRLALGSQGDEVKTIQDLLAQDKEVYPEGLITGYFGSLTKKAVQKFQEKYNIAKKGDVGYGDVGPNTRAKINQILAGVAAPAAVPQLPTQAAEQAQLIQQIRTQLQTLQEQLVQLLAELAQKLQEQIQQKLGQ